MGAARLAEALATLDDPAKAVVRSAHDEAYRHGSGILSSAHLLLALLESPPPAASSVFARASQWSPEPERVFAAVRRQVEYRLGAYIRPAPRLVHLPYTVHARAILIHAAARAQQCRSGLTGIADIWRAMVNAPGSLAACSLDDLGVLPDLRQALN